MAQIAVTILDPSNHRSAHLIETRLPTRDVIPPIVARLRLPERATYQLFPLGSDHSLPKDQTFAELGVPAGAELQLKPVRNAILKAILDKLYDEAKGYVEARAWEFAKEKLEELLALDPTYPDPLGLEAAVAANAGALQNAPPDIPPDVSPNISPPGQFASRSQSASSARPFAASAPGLPRANTPTSPPNAGRAFELKPDPAAGSGGASCLGITLTIVAVIVAGGIALVGTVLFLPGFLDEMAERIGIALPGTVILGTGDVQVTLRWTGEADLDLHVIDPNGEEISFANPQSASGGELDVDANGACEGLARPVENVYWPVGGAPSGTYEVYVEYYQLCGMTAPVDYEVTITLDGEVVDRIDAQISDAGEQHPITNFNY